MNRAEIGLRTRRQVLVGAAGLALAPLLLRPARATPEAVAAAMREVVGEAAVRQGRVEVEIPPLAENGNSVSLMVKVDSPMTESDHVKSIHVFAEQNPLPNVAHFHLGPRAGRAQVSTRIRLASSQFVTAVAAMSDGSFWSGSAEVIITLAACIETG
jgi:sulfur-oxidizing protein SoxY